jgi:hypothetical protein
VGPDEENEPSAHMISNAELQVREQQFSDLQDQVIQIVKQNSLLREAE